MARVRLRLDHDGVAEVLKHSPALDALVQRKADEVAEAARDEVARALTDRTRLPLVTVQHHTTDREHDTVMVHTLGMLLQTRDGVLTRAASAAGLRFRKADTDEGDTK